MKKFIMLEIAVQVETADLEDVNDIVDNLNIHIEGNDVVETVESQVENFYEFEA